MSYADAVRSSHADIAGKPASMQPTVDHAFERNVEHAFSVLSSQLAEIRASMANMPASISDGLPHVVRAAVMDVVPLIRPTSHKGVQVDPRHLQGMQDHIQHLTNENTSLVEMKASFEREISSLRNELTKKNRETRELHDIIIQSGQSNTDVSDEDTVKKFGDLSHEIMRLVSRHYNRPETRTNLALNRMTRDDRALFVRALIANCVYRKFFSSEAQLFGFDPERDAHQRELESKLRERGVAEQDITDWRVATVKVGAKMDLKKRYNHALKVSSELMEELQNICVVPDLNAAVHDTRQLCVSAFELGLQLRGCKSMYEWRQAVRPESLPESDIELTGPFDARDHLAPLGPVKVLFGPLYKIVDGEVVLLRPGDVLGGN